MMTLNRATANFFLLLSIAVLLTVFTASTLTHAQSDAEPTEPSGETVPAGGEPAQPTNLPTNTAEPTVEPPTATLIPTDPPTEIPVLPTEIVPTAIVTEIP